MDLVELVSNKLKNNFPEIDFEFVFEKNEFSISMGKENINKVCKYLKTDEELEFLMCSDITGIDWAVNSNRFEVVYHLFTMKHNYRIRLKCRVDEADLAVDTVSDVWKTADWQEREVFDMFGINFKNHPDLRRMYMPEEFEYYPLRKDFPLMGIPGSNPLPKK